MGLSAFVLEDRLVYHTYSCHLRGVEEFNVTYQMLDRASRGRDEGGFPDPQAWIQRWDKYESAATSKSRHTCCSHRSQTTASLAGDHHAGRSEP